MFGPDYLVASVLQNGVASRDVYLPPLLVGAVCRNVFTGVETNTSAGGKRISEEDELYGDNVLIIDAPAIQINKTQSNGDVQKELFDEGDSKSPTNSTPSSTKKKVVRKKRKVTKKKTTKKKKAKKKVARKK